MNNIDKQIDLDRTQRVVSETLYSIEDAIPFKWLFDYMDNHFPEKMQSRSYLALAQMYHDYCRDLERNKK